MNESRPTDEAAAPAPSMDPELVRLWLVLDQLRQKVAALRKSMEETPGT